MTLREFRLLLPWFDQRSAVRFLVGARPTPEAVTAAAERWAAAEGKLRLRKIDAFSTSTEPLPASLSALARDFAAATNFTSIPEFVDAELRLVELASLLTFQAKISTGDARARFLDPYDGSLESIFRVCLPITARMDPVQVKTEGALATVSSDNPNLRFGGFQLNGTALVATFGFRPPWLQVVEYKGRLFVRNGYHRAWALFNAGARFAVAVTAKAATLAELGADEAGYISEAQLLSSAPPMLYDFEDPVLYATGTGPAARRVITITASESMELPTT